jgi:WD40 repeat protein
MARNEKKPAGLLFLEGISCLSFNKDYKYAALSKRDHIIYIYSVSNVMSPDSWKLVTKLDSHTNYISGIDWNHTTNKILSCSYDKTSFVFENTSNRWLPSSVVATTKLGFLCCKWNKKGDKFCEGTSAKHLFIGYFNTQSGWWMGRNIKCHKSSVVSCEIDGSSLYVISGSVDLRVFVSSCYLPDVDGQQNAPEFGTTIYEFRANCWVNSVTFCGGYGIAAGQNATIGVIDFGSQKTNLIKCKHAPVLMVLPSGPNSFLAICFDRQIIEYEKKGDKFEIKRTITSGGAKASGPASGVSGALQKFSAMGNQKKENLAVTTKQYAHLHKSLISSVTIKGKDLITTDLSGFVKYWKL